MSGGGISTLMLKDSRCPSHRGGRYLKSLLKGARRSAHPQTSGSAGGRPCGELDRRTHHREIVFETGYSTIDIQVLSGLGRSQMIALNHKAERHDHQDSDPFHGHRRNSWLT